MINFVDLGKKEYQDVWEQMKYFTDNRDAHTTDEVWLLEHPPVYTQGQAGKAQHILNPQSIPIVQSDRGGQVTYHGPGQLVAYILFDIKRRDLGVRTLVSQLENCLIEVLSHYDIDGQTKCKAPGVYVAERKIASIGLRVKNGRTYHGIALNVNMDITPFKGINPCGFSDMDMTQIADVYPSVSMDTVKMQFSNAITKQFEA